MIDKTDYWHHQWSMQEKISCPQKWWKQFTSLTMIAPTSFEMNFVGEWHLHKPTDLLLFRLEYQELCWWAHCNSQFLTMVTQMKHPFFFFHIMQHKLVYCTHPMSHTLSPDNLFSSAQISIIWGWSWLSTTNLCTWLSKCDPAVSLHLNPFSAVQLSHRDACCQVLAAA
jgi:hypothetical protein